MSHALGTTGVFTSLGRSRSSGLATTSEAAEAAGFSSLWIADVRGDLTFAGEMLAATRDLVVGTAVLSIWDLEAEDAGRLWQDHEAHHPGRFVLGVGPSHPSLVAAKGQTYDKPLTRTEAYLDTLDRSGPQHDARILGANGPKMLQLAARRSLGAITQNVTVAATASQRNLLGPDAILAAEVKIVVGGSSEDVGRIGRANLSHYLGMPSYRKNLTSMGFTDDDLDDGGSDRLLDALVTGPDPDAIRTRIAAHRDAGADHVSLHVLTDQPAAPLDEWKALGALLELEAG
ncbi:MAG: hypothetical protein QOH68_814 [Nocardioidaceae bacterium]|jgi:probable F420-dependent oxidoreductase|nr:hypothetical protein [Nocardioidaceae bacterium]